MDQTTQPSVGPSTRTIAVALLAGLAVLLLLFPGSGNDALPPTCYSLFGYIVPCDAWVAWAAGAGTAGLVALALWPSDRREARRTPQ